MKGDDSNRDLASQCRVLPFDTVLQRSLEHSALDWIPQSGSDDIDTAGLSMGCSSTTSSSSVGILPISHASSSETRHVGKTYQTF